MTKTILITGATGGIGRHLALHLSKKGHRVIATGRKEGLLAQLRSEASLEVLALDVNDRASIARAAAEVARMTNGAGVDVLVNNAGYGEAAAMMDVREDDVRAMFETNVFGLLAVTQAFLPAMVERGAGRVINISSVGGRATLPLFGAYNATKFAVESMSNAMRMELQPLGIDVVVVEPSATKTEFANTSARKISTYLSMQSPYAKVYARGDELVASAESMAAEPQVIVDAIVRAIEARSPKPRYVAPLSGRVVLWMQALLPTRVFDWMLMRAFGITKQTVMLPSTSG